MGIRFLDSDGKEKEITPAMYQKIRPIIAAQNGVKLESDEANPEIVKAKKAMADGGGNLDPNINDLISAVSALTHFDEDEIDNWPILKLNKRASSFERILAYIVCGIGEASGATWKNGNPNPHPYFGRADDGSGLFNPMGGTDQSENNQNVPQHIKDVAAQTIQFPQ